MQKRLAFSLTFFGLLAATMAALVADVEMEGTACIANTTDCDDNLPIMVPGEGESEGTCLVISCENGPSDFTACQVTTSGGACDVSEESAATCTGPCMVWECGTPSEGENCDFASCDLDPENGQEDPDGEDATQEFNTCT